jgi:hypothetical protein
MTLSKKTSWSPAIRESALRSGTPKSTRQRTQTRSIAVWNRVNYRLVEEIGDWMLLAGVSLVGWITAAIAFGII